MAAPQISPLSAPLRIHTFPQFSLPGYFGNSFYVLVFIWYAYSPVLIFTVSLWVLQDYRFISSLVLWLLAVFATGILLSLSHLISSTQAASIQDWSQSRLSFRMAAPQISPFSAPLRIHTFPQFSLPGYFGNSFYVLVFIWYAYPPVLIFPVSLWVLQHYRFLSSLVLWPLIVFATGILLSLSHWVSSTQAFSILATWSNQDFSVDKSTHSFERYVAFSLGLRVTFLLPLLP
jgi:hypothetical protein